MEVAARLLAEMSVPGAVWRSAATDCVVPTSWSCASWRTVDVHDDVDGTWEPLVHLDDQHPTGEVAVGDHGVVPLDLSSILPS